MTNTSSKEIKLLKTSRNGRWKYFLVNKTTCNIPHLDEQISELEQITKHTYVFKDLDRRVSFFEITPDLKMPKHWTEKSYIFLSNFYQEGEVSYINYVERFTGGSAMNHMLRIKDNKVEEMMCRLSIMF